MATQVKHRRGNSNEISTFTPASGEIIVNTDTNTLVVGDGVTIGGHSVGGVSDIQVATFADLRNVTAYYDGQQFELLGHTTAGVGGGTFYYDASDTTSADDNGVIAVSGTQRFKRQDTKFVTPEMYGAVRTRATNTAALQAIADAGFACAYLLPNDTAYQFNTITCTTHHFHLKGLTDVNGTKPVVEVDGTIIQNGSHTGAKIDDSVKYENIIFNVIGDCISGILDLRSCRNWVIDKTVQVIANQEYWLGTLVNGSRSYQCGIHAVIQAKGVSAMEIGDVSGGEVLDTFDFTGLFYAGNAAIFQRDLTRNFNFHNIDLSGGKYREFFNSDEATLANQGVTYITSDVSAGDTSLTVNDATQLKQGNLGENDLIYLGMRNVAEELRVLSVVGSVINLDPNTPVRFDHTSDVESTGFGEPVVFGPVYVTLDVPRGLVANVLHMERACIAINAYSPLSMNIEAFHGTSKYMFGQHNSGRGNRVGAVYGGDAGYADPVEIMYRFPSAATFQEALKLETFPEFIASWEPYTDDSTNTAPLIEYQPTTQNVIPRVFAETFIEARRTGATVVEMDGSITSVRLQAGTFIGQTHEVVFRQDSTGYRLLLGFDAINTPSADFLASQRPYSTRTIKFRWDGSNWIEIFRSVRDGNVLPSFNFTELSDISNTVNTESKEEGMLVINTTDSIVYRAAGSAAGDDWVAVDNSNTITPV